MQQKKKSKDTHNRKKQPQEKKCNDFSKRTLEINEEKKELFLNPAIYSLDVIYRTCFVFLNKVYIFLDAENNGKIRVELTPKNPMNETEWLSMVGEFKNELLASNLRDSISKTAGKIRDLIVEKAIIGALPSQPSKASDSKTELSSLEEENLDFLDDPLGIAIPWEEKYGKKS